MRTTARWFTGVCVLLVALPTAPCAWISQGCPFEAGGLLAGRDAAPRSCCARHSQASDAATSTAATAASDAPAKPAAPCTRDCCKVRSLPPVPEKVIAEQSAMPLLMATVDATLVPAMAWESLDREVQHLDPSLQILHCQWRL